MPAVSVIIPTYNRANLLGKAIQSVLDQTYQNFEIIVVDDASTDNTEEVVRNFNNEKIRYICHKKNSGDAAARNTGVKAARGRYIAPQDSDDIWLPEKLEKQIRTFEQNRSKKLGVVYTGFWRIKDGEEVYTPPPEIEPKQGYIHNILLVKNFIGMPTAVIKTECFEKAGLFYEGLPHLVDWEFWIRISRYYHFSYINEPLVKSYYTADSISSDDQALLTAMELILRRHYEDFKKNRQVLAKHAYAIGSTLCRRGEMSSGRAYILEAVKACPFNAKFDLAALVSFFGHKAYKKYVGLKGRR